MITITNVETVKGSICKYVLKINDKVITTFKHDRNDGLAECLKDAAFAVYVEETIRKRLNDIRE